MDKIKRYCWVGVCLWVLLAFVSWQYESSCGVFFASGCLSEYWLGIRWVVLIKWVATYQTLIAGIAAIAGGYFVLVSQRIQISEARRVSKEVQNNAFLSSLATVRAECLHASDYLRSDDLHAPENLELTRAAFPIFSFRDPKLMHITMSVTYRLEQALHEKSKGCDCTFTQSKLLAVSSIGMAYAEMLFQIREKLEKEEESNVDLKMFDGIPLYHFLERRGQTPSVLFELSPYFRWPVEQHAEDEWRP